MGETIVLDPTAEATNRTQLDLTPWVSADGIDWGDAVFEAIAAQSERGDLVVDGRLPNRIITVPLKLRTVGATSFATIRQSIQQKVGLFQREGGWVMRQVGATPHYADVVNASLSLGGSLLQAVKDIDVDAVLTLECVPDWYLAEVDLGDNVETTLPELIFTDTGVTGNYPGRIRVVVDEDQGQHQKGLLWGIRCRNYSSATTAALAYAGTALQRLDTAGTASGAVVHTNLAADWTPVLGTNIGGTSFLTHVGSYRTWAAIASTANGDDVSCRFVWDVGDLVNPVANPSYTIPSTAGTFIADLGEIRLDQSPVGTHRWQGVIQAKGVAGGEGVQISRLWFQPLDEGGGYLRAPLTGSAGLATYTARDEFLQTAGTLTGKAAGVGGNWTGAGDTDDFSLDTSNHVAARTATSDTGPEFNGRYEISGASAMTATLVQVDFKYGVAPASIWGSNGARYGVLARYTDTNNYAKFHITSLGVFGESYVTLDWIAGGVRNAASMRFDLPSSSHVTFGIWWTLRLLIDTSGQYACWFFPTGGAAGDPVIVGQHSVFATGGALASGKPGIYDEYTEGVAATRWYDNFAAWAPTLDAVAYANRSLELRTEGAFRQDVGGTAYGPVSHQVGPLPRMPPSGLESRTIQVFVKGSRGDLGQLPDVAADDISARVFYRPSFLYVS